MFAHLPRGAVLTAFLFPLALLVLPAPVRAQCAAWNAPITWSRHLGGGMADPLRSTDEVHGVVMNERGEVFVTGRTNSLDFPGTMGVPSGGSGQDAFVTKFLPDGRRAWSRGFGGSGTDSARRLALGPSGELYVVGRTTSPSILPGSGDSFQTKLTHQGGTDAFLARLSAEGQLEWFMYLGGGEEDRGLDVAVTADGKKVYVSGSTTSAMQAPPGEEYGLRGSGYDAFILQVDVSTANAPEHMWTRFIGTKSLVSNADDEAYAVAVRGDAVYVGGVVGSRLTDVDSSYKPIKLYQEGAYDGFVARLSSTGDVVWFTHVGANGEDEVQDLLVRPAGELIVVGETNSSSFSTVPSLGGYDAFVLQLGADGKETGQVKRLGGNGDDKVEGHAAMDPSGNVFVGGRTVSDKIASRGFDNTFEPTSDGFVMMVNPELTRVVWASYVGGSVGSREEWVRGVAVDTQGRLALGGHSPSTTSFLESGGGAEDPPKGGEEGFVIGVRMDLTAPLAGAVTAGVTPEGWLSATWTDFQEPETAIVEYAWAISTPEGTLVRDFTVKETLEDTRVVVEDFNPELGKRYSIVVRATNTAGCTTTVSSAELLPKPPPEVPEEPEVPGGTPPVLEDQAVVGWSCGSDVTNGGPRALVSGALAGLVWFASRRRMQPKRS